MSTTLLKKETVQRKWYVLDAAGKPLGRTAVIAASLLRGKHKTDFTPTWIAVISSSSLIRIRRFSPARSRSRSCTAVIPAGIGGLKETKARLMMEKRSDYAMELAVKGMLPKNSLGRAALTRLKLFKGAEHNHAAQKPEPWTQD